MNTSFKLSLFFRFAHQNSVHLPTLVLYARSGLKLPNYVCAASQIKKILILSLTASH